MVPETTWPGAIWVMLRSHPGEYLSYGNVWTFIRDHGLY